MDDQPSSGVEVLVGEAFGLLGEFEFEIAWGEDMECGWGSVLDDEGGLLGFGDDSAEAGEADCIGFYLYQQIVR